MTYSRPSQILVDEHSVILSVLDAVESVNQHADFSASFYERALDFFVTFADKCHHAKEEVHLFPWLEAHGVAREHGPVGCMLREHEEGRAHLGAVRNDLPAAAAGDHDAQARIRREMAAYAILLREHINKENQVLFVIGDMRMSSADEEALLAKFNCEKHTPLPPGTHGKYTDLAAELQREAGLTAASQG